MEPDKLGGKPCVRDMRISVADVLEYLASGMSIDEILSDFPDLARDDVLACLAYAKILQPYGTVIVTGWAPADPCACRSGPLAEQRQAAVFIGNHD